MAQGNIQEAITQLDFLKELQPTVEKMAVIFIKIKVTLFLFKI